MQFISEDPLNASCRIIDMARRLGLEFRTFSMSLRTDGTALIEWSLAEPDCSAAPVFSRRVATLCPPVPEFDHV